MTTSHLSEFQRDKDELFQKASETAQSFYAYLNNALAELVKLLEAETGAFEQEILNLEHQLESLRLENALLDSDQLEQKNGAVVKMMREAMGIINSTNKPSFQ